MALNVQPNSGSNLKAFQPFTQRVVDLDYIAPVAGPVVFLSSGSDDCGSAFPYDPRNLSLGGIYRNMAASYVYAQPGLPDLQINVQDNRFFSVVSQAAAQERACECAAAKAVSLGYTSATCILAAITDFDGNVLVTFDGVELTTF